MHKPLIVYVSGAPGSGKSTLAKILSERLYLPHVSSDLMHNGVRFSEGQRNDRHASFHDVFVPLMIEMAHKNVSFVVDQVLQRGLSENDVIAKLTPVANIIIVQTLADDPIARHLNRVLASDETGAHYTEEELRSRAEFHRSNLERTIQPLEVDVPVLIVNTNEGYSPTIERIVEFIKDIHNKQED